METVTLPFRHGPKKKLVLPKGDQWTGRSVELYGEYSENEVDVFREFIRPDDVCIDAGALFGAHTLAMAELGQSVHAFEPQDSAFRILRENIRSNHGMVYSYPLALGMSEGAARMETGEHLGLNRILEYDWPIDNTVRVEVRTPSGLWPCKVDFIKIDVEGYELKVLGGAVLCLVLTQPVIYLEFQEQQEAIVETLRSYGYLELWKHNVPQDRYPNFSMRPLEYDPGPGPVMLLAVPNHRWNDHREFVKSRFTRI